MVLQYTLITIGALQILTLLGFVILLHKQNKMLKLLQERSLEESKTKPEESSSLLGLPSSASPSKLLPWLSRPSRDDMIESFRVLAEAKKHERK